MRFDVLLFELRLFKSRSQASAAIQDGTVLLNGTSVKPSREAHAGDRIVFAGASPPRALEVLELPHGSISKERARTLVREIAPDLR